MNLLHIVGTNISFFSYSIYKDNIGKLIYTSNAKYTGIITNEGRIPKIPLEYMAEVYDQFIFRKLFKFNFVNITFFFVSRLGRICYFYLSNIRKRNLNLEILFLPFNSLFYAIYHRKAIKKGDLSFYRRDFGDN